MGLVARGALPEVQGKQHAAGDAGAEEDRHHDAVAQAFAGLVAARNVPIRRMVRIGHRHRILLGQMRETVPACQRWRSGCAMAGTKM